MYYDVPNSFWFLLLCLIAVIVFSFSFFIFHLQIIIKRKINDTQSIKRRSAGVSSSSLSRTAADHLQHSSTSAAAAQRQTGETSINDDDNSNII